MIPRNEYPRPQLERDSFINLNGEWDFEIDNACVGKEKEFFKRKSLNNKIIVPFCPESKLSGIKNTDFMNCVWYKKDFNSEKLSECKRLILHFGAVDYRAELYINGEYVGKHRGGYTSFSFDITKYIKEGENSISLCAYDDLRSANQPSGKQSQLLNSGGCSYTRTTGIWQTVWMEEVSSCHIKNIKMTTEIEPAKLSLIAYLSDSFFGAELSAKAFYNGKCAGKSSASANSATVDLSLELSEKHLWELGCGRLYELEIEVKKGGVICDKVKSYFGLREICLDGGVFKLNGKPVFQRLVLDQGFYPDGIYTAPSDEALEADIISSMNFGFNGARLHEKVFEPRFLYYADKHGYLVWGEHANWGLDITEMGQIQYFLPEWLEAVERDFNHPSIIGWCPFNETCDRNGRCQCNMLIETVYKITKALDPTRPVIDTSGCIHVITDIFDIHNYIQIPEEFEKIFKELDKGILGEHFMSERQKYTGGLVFVSEYGGIKWVKDNTSEGWGYGDAPKTEEEFIERYKGLTEILLNNKYIMGFCYTQLYDVEQEVNGLMTYDRKNKFDPEIFKRINSKPAAIEL